MTGSAPTRRIAVLFHEGDRHTNLSGYIVDHLAGFWREDGHEVTYVFGTRRFVPADVLFVHVNLSVVPDDYLAFAARYPVVVNGRIRDIRKSVISENLLRRGDTWTGPVIVKSDLNFAGSPEIVLRRGWLQRKSLTWRRLHLVGRTLAGRTPTFGSWQDYLIFDTLDGVPEKFFTDPKVVVEKFLPEIEDGLYRLRMYQFLGHRSSCTRLASPSPLMKAETSVHVEQIEPHPDVLLWREKLTMDYGKLDYLEHDGQVVLIDVNKTTGASTHIADEELRRMRRYQAEGLYSFFR